MLKDLFDNGRISISKLVEYKKKNRITVFTTTKGSYSVDMDNIIQHYQEPKQTYYAIKLLDCVDGNLNLVSNVVINEKYLVSIETYEVTE